MQPSKYTLNIKDKLINFVGLIFKLVYCESNFIAIFLHHSCREKKDTEVQCLETTKDGEAENLGGIEKENEELRETLVKLKNHYAKVCISNEVYITNIYNRLRAQILA